MFLKVTNKLRKTITDGARTTKPIKTSMNHDINKIQLFITKLKNALISEQSKNSELQSALNILKENTQSIPTYTNIAKDSQFTSKYTTHQRGMFSLYRAMTRKKHQKIYKK